MKRWGLFLLRVSTGWLLVLWGLDKLLNVDHSLQVAEAYYFGIGTSRVFLGAFGVLEALLGVCVVLGVWRRRLYPAVVAILAVTAIGVWRSILDPWGWFLEGSNVLFYPSLIIVAAALTLWGTIDDDTLVLEARR